MSKTRANLGQHFLIDSPTAEKIAGAAEITSDDMVLEIGPGTGFLTQRLLDYNPKELIAIEKDGDLHHKLKKRFRDHQNARFIHQDIREFNIASLPANYKLVANIPYYLTGKIIRDFLDHSNRPNRLVLLIQKEVAERLLAPKGQGTLLQMTVLNFAEPELVIKVGRDKFAPPPRVDSSVVKLNVFSHPRVDKENRRPFFRLLKFAFSGRRKTLPNTIGKALDISKEELTRILAKQGVTANSRPQELTFPQWYGLFQDLKSEKFL